MSRRVIVCSFVDCIREIETGATRVQRIYGGNNEKSVLGSFIFPERNDDRGICTVRSRRHHEHRSGQDLRY